MKKLLIGLFVLGIFLSLAGSIAEKHSYSPETIDIKFISSGIFQVELGRVYSIQNYFTNL